MKQTNFIASSHSVAKKIAPLLEFCDCCNLAVGFNGKPLELSEAELNVVYTYWQLFGEIRKGNPELNEYIRKMRG